MDAGLGAGGAEDRNSLKYDGLCYACLNGFDPPIPFCDDKSAYHGFNHIQIAELSCPIYHLPKFAEDTHRYVVTSDGAYKFESLWMPPAFSKNSRMAK